MPYRQVIVFFFCIYQILSVKAQVADTSTHNVASFSPAFHFGKAVKNAPQAPVTNSSFLFELAYQVQTIGTKAWQQPLGFPEIDYTFYFANLGNAKEVGNLAALAPALTFNSLNKKWFVPRVKLALGVAYSSNPYKIGENENNYYLGSTFSAFGQAALFVQPRLNQQFLLRFGISVIHASNGHVQIPNLGVNMPTVFASLHYSPRKFQLNPRKTQIELPETHIRFNIRTGIGAHQLARTTEPIGTPKYAIYVTDLYLSKCIGKVSNLQAGISFKFYNSYYNYIERNNFFTDNQKMKASVIHLFIAHELLMGKFSVLALGGINLYNPFYNKYIKMYKSEIGSKTWLKKYIPTRLGIQYYLRNPKYFTRSNLFVGTYINANFGTADFISSQVGFVF